MRRGTRSDGAPSAPSPRPSRDAAPDGPDGPDAAGPPRAPARYERLAASLARDIRERVYPAGALLPTEHALCERHRLSRHTVRAALQRLADMGLVVRQPGVGTRVEASEPTTSYSFAMDSMSDLAGYAREAWLRIDRRASIRAWGATARALACREGTAWLHLVGRRFPVDAPAPVAVSEIYLRDRYPGIVGLIERSHDSIPSILESHYAQTVEEIVQHMHPVAIGAPDAGRLGIAAGTPGLEIVRRYLAADGRLLLLGRVVHPAGSIGYSMRLRRRAAP